MTFQNCRRVTRITIKPRHSTSEFCNWMSVLQGFPRNLRVVGSHRWAVPDELGLNPHCTTNRVTFGTLGQYLTSLCLSFLTCKIGLFYKDWVNMYLIQCSEQCLALYKLGIHVNLHYYAEIWWKWRERAQKICLPRSFNRSERVTLFKLSSFICLFFPTPRITAAWTRGRT